MVDAPHQFRNTRTGGSLKSGSAQKYPVLSLDELKALPIQNIMDRNSLLLYWTPTALVPESLEVIRAWGYTYVTSLYWIKTQKHNPDKIRTGMGYNVRGAVEECWICRKGKVPALRIQNPNVVFAPIGEHSAKPYEVYRFFEEATERLGLTPRADIFARIGRPGWEPIGNAIDGRDIRDVLATPIEEWQSVATHPTAGLCLVRDGDH